MDCYLCGASNTPDADFCVRCSGQLLRIGAEPELQPPAIPLIDEPDVEPDVEPESNMGGHSARRMPTISSVDHRRLQAALGLDDPSPIDGPEQPGPQVATARPQADIPIIGTSTHNLQPARFGQDEAGTFAYVLLGLLVLAVGWLAWTTLDRSDSLENRPENLAFATTTIAPTTTTTTDPPRQWNANEVEGRFGASFVRIFLYDCPEGDDAAAQNVEALDEQLTHGVVVNEYNVIIPASAVGNADIATVRGRLGSTTIARVNPHRSGAAAVTTVARINRNLQLDETATGTDTFYVHYNFENNDSVVATIESTSDLELTVTDQGEATAVRLGRRVVEHDELLDLARFRTERVFIEGAPEPGTVCDELKFLIDTTPEIQSGTEAADEVPES